MRSACRRGRICRGRSWRIASVRAAALVVVLAQLLWPLPARADGPVTCWPGPDGVQVCITIPAPGSGQGSPGGDNQPGGSSAQPPANPSGGGNPPTAAGAPGIGQGPPQGVCAVAAVMGQPCAAPTAPVAAVAAAAAPPPPLPVDAVAEATKLCATLALPQAEIRVNPTLGLVNLPSWFWLAGYTGQTLSASETTAPPYEIVTIEVRALPTRVTWAYGDGSPPVSHGDAAGPLDSEWFGQPYPRESEVAHTYAFSSLNYPDGFPVVATVEWATEYRVNGGAYQRLGVVLTRNYSGAHRVQEVQPLLTNP